MGFFTQFNGQVRDPIYGYIDYTKELEGVVMDSWVCCFPGGGLGCGLYLCLACCLYMFADMSLSCWSGFA